MSDIEKNLRRELAEVAAGIVRLSARLDSLERAEKEIQRTSDRIADMRMVWRKAA